MATKKPLRRKSTGKKAAVKKASTKKSPAKKTARKSVKKAVKKPVKKAAPKAGPKKKSSSKKTPSKKTTPRKQAKRHVKPKLGFDPLSREDIDVLTAPGVTGAPLRDEDHHTGIDALIRDTSHEQAVTPALHEIEDAAEKETLTALEPEDVSEKAAPVSLELAEGPAEQPGPETKEAGTASIEPKKALEPSPAQADLRDQEDEERVGLATFFSFRLGDESFAIPIERVREVLQYQAPTKVPKTPPYMLGVINLRGGVVPVVGLRVLFAMTEAERTVHSAVIILEVDNEGEKSTIGLLVDSVREVMDLRDSDIAPPPRLGTGLNTDFISGMGKFGDEFLMILDIDRAFSAADLL